MRRLKKEYDLFELYSEMPCGGVYYKLELIIDYIKRVDLLIPMKLEKKENSNKYSKKPLVKWRSIDKESLIKVVKKEYPCPLAIILDNYDLIVLDIDNVELFEERVAKIDELLDDMNYFGVVKTISGGYHFYLLRSEYQRLIDFDKLNNKMLLNEYGFEIRTQGLLLTPCTILENEECKYELISSKHMDFYTDDDGIQTTVMNQLLNILLSELSVDEEQNKDLKGLIKKIKKNVKFDDLDFLNERKAKEYSTYIMYHCPFHEPDKVPSFAVYKNVDGEIAVDFHDYAKYNVITLYSKYKNISIRQAIEELSNFINSRSKNTKQQKQDLDTEDLEAVKNTIFEIDDYVYVVKKGGLKMAGPAIKVEAKILDADTITYECVYKSTKFLLKDVQDFETIRKKTGKAIVDEKAYKEYMNIITDQCEKVKKVFREIGFVNGEYIHPCSTSTEGIWSEFVFIKEIEKAKRFYNPEAHLNLIREALRDGRALGFIYCFALASLIAEQLNCSPVTLFIEGPARIGKTTLGLLAANLFYPGQEISFSADFTRVGLELTLKTLRNCVVLLDELAVSNMDTEQIVFAISSGRGRVRGTKHLTVKYSNLSSYVIFTSEVSDTEIFKRAGAYRRFIKLSLLKRDDICQFADISYLRLHASIWGAGVELAKFIQANPEKVREIANEAEKIIVKSNYLSMYNVALPLLTSLIILEVFFEEKFDAMCDYILKMLNEHIKEFEKQIDFKSKFIEKFTEFVLVNINKFVRDEVIRFRDYDDVNEREFMNEKYIEITPKGEVYGKIEDDKVYVLPTVFKRFLKDTGFTIEAIKLLAELNIIEKKEKDRFTVKITILDQRVNAYCINIDLEDLEEKKEEKEEEKVNKPFVISQPYIEKVEKEGGQEAEKDEQEESYLPDLDIPL